ncbi:OmpA family protein [Hymenobacter cavernae]|uniref:OmpA-like domain-containing protein n=1 Tax=Hymenobacter cavernae TaxID=2044852 RepID=A0ABQ1UIA3_9BACT|nr:OmpA family protein [Hymenobacter cavernae]GGF18068.1 hypothetical protein GCM10011383_31910 [Hymenobacter cavernae]
MREEGTILESISACFTEELLQRLSATLGPSPSVIRQALDRVVPLVINSLQNWVARPTGVEVLWNLTRHAHEASFLNQLHTPAAFEGRGGRLMQDLLGDTYMGIISPLRAGADLSEASFALLMEVAVATVLGTFGKYAADHQLDATRLSRWLRQQQSVVPVLPPAQAGNFVPPPLSPTPRTKPASAPKPSSPEKDVLHRFTVAGAGTWEKVGGGITFTPSRRGNWLTKRRRWQLALLVVLVLGVGYLASSYLNQSEPTTALASAPPAEAPLEAANVVAASYNDPNAPVSEPLATAVPAGHYDPSTDTYIYTIGQPLVLTLPDGSKQRVGTNSTEYRLYRLLTDPSQRFDGQSLASGWINVDRVYFTPGQATLTAESQQQLQNLASILKAFPQARIKLGGYTDSIGDPQKNLLLSQSRAATAMQALVKLGVDPNRLQAEGYGAQHFVASNAGPVGRALNRRLSLQVLDNMGALTAAKVPAAAMPVAAAAAASATAAHAAPAHTRTTKATKARRSVRRKTKSSRWFKGILQRLRGKKAHRS